MQCSDQISTGVGTCKKSKRVLGGAGGIGADVFRGTACALGREDRGSGARRDS